MKKMTKAVVAAILISAITACSTVPNSGNSDTPTQPTNNQTSENQQSTGSMRAVWVVAGVVVAALLINELAKDTADDIGDAMF